MTTHQTRSAKLARFQLLLTPQQLRRLRLIAKAQTVPNVTAVIREAIDQYLLSLRPPAGPES